MMNKISCYDMTRYLVFANDGPYTILMARTRLLESAVQVIIDEIEYWGDACTRDNCYTIAEEEQTEEDV